jgi:hypothetical protein
MRPEALSAWRHGLEESEVSRITITCPDCGKRITVEIPTIDQLRADLEAALRESQTLRQRLAAKELMDHSSPFDDLNRLFGGRL